MSLWTRLKSHLIFLSGAGFIYRQLFMHSPQVPTETSLVGQTAIITGSNTGLGLEAGRQLLHLNLSRLILAVRSRTKGDVAAKVLSHEFPHTKVEVWILDMEDYESVAAFCKKCETLGRIDIAILNAGIQNKDHRISVKTGKEQTFQVNYLSTIMLAVLLLPILKAKEGFLGKPARLSVVTSTTAYFADFDHKKPIISQFEADYDVRKWYSREKLLQMMFIRRLAGLFSPDDVIINTVCPGLVGNTEIWRSLNTIAVLKRFLSLYFMLFGRSLQEGASTYVHAVVLAGRESHGSFLSDWGVRPYPSVMYTTSGESFENELFRETIKEMENASISVPWIKELEYGSK